jgi:hypothetical protein
VVFGARLTGGPSASACEGFSGPTVTLQEEEADAWVWVPTARIPGILASTSQRGLLEAWLQKTTANTDTVTIISTTSSTVTDTTEESSYERVLLDARRHLCGIYPNEHQEGISQAYMFILEHLSPYLSGRVLTKSEL